MDLCRIGSENVDKFPKKNREKIVEKKSFNAAIDKQEKCMCI